MKWLRESEMPPLLVLVVLLAAPLEPRISALPLGLALGWLAAIIDNKEPTP